VVAGRSAEPTAEDPPCAVELTAAARRERSGVDGDAAQAPARYSAAMAESDETLEAPRGTPPHEENREVIAPDDPVHAAGFAERYLRHGVLGEGGMGTVLSCADQTIGRTVALKVIRGGRTAHARRAEQRFLREARVQGQLEHPAVVPVYDLGVDPEGAVYFTMKRVRGRTLEEILSARDAGFSRHQILTALGRVCLAIDFAHRRGVLHRDLKPGNLMLGDYGEVYVLDWGLAKVRGQEDLDAEVGEDEHVTLSSSGDRTAAGAILGTPGYMSPEQSAGEAELGPPSDVYALGAILFEILTGAPLHPEESALARMRATLRGAEARPSVRAPDGQVAPELEAICVRACALDPAERYESARALHDALEHFLAGERDVEARREMAKTHAARAREAEARVRGGQGSLDERRAAMREVGRALALDPENEEALSAMVSLLTRPPAQLPPEVREEIDAAEAEHRRAGARLASFAYASMLFYAPFFLWIGVRDPWPIALLFGTALVTAAGAALVARHPRASDNAPLAVMFLSNLAFAATTTFYGPLLLVPAMVVANTTAFTINLRGRWRRWLAMATGSAVILVPLALEALGVIAPTYTFEGGDALTVHARAIPLDSAPTLAFLTLTSVAPIFMSGTLVGALRGALAAAEERLHLYAWHLREIVPDTASGARGSSDGARTSLVPPLARASAPSATAPTLDADRE
jgi:hypothetical protein